MEWFSGDAFITWLILCGVNAVATLIWIKQGISKNQSETKTSVQAGYFDPFAACVKQSSTARQLDVLARRLRPDERVVFVQGNSSKAPWWWGMYLKILISWCVLLMILPWPLITQFDVYPLVVLQPIIQPVLMGMIFAIVFPAASWSARKSYSCFAVSTQRIFKMEIVGDSGSVRVNNEYEALDIDYYIVETRSFGYGKNSSSRRYLKFKKDTVSKTGSNLSKDVVEFSILASKVKVANALRNGGYKDVATWDDAQDAMKYGPGAQAIPVQQPQRPARLPGRDNVPPAHYQLPTEDRRPAAPPAAAPSQDYERSRLPAYEPPAANYGSDYTQPPAQVDYAPPSTYDPYSGYAQAEKRTNDPYNSGRDATAPDPYSFQGR